MLAPPTTDWGSEPQSAAGWMRLAPEPGTWSERRQIVHVFTHFTLELRVFETLTPSRSGDYRWTSLEAAVSCVPSVFRKALTASAGPYLNDDTILDDI
jgi:A/G-specific adenine glycosylase